MELKNKNLIELSNDEMVQIDGGKFWKFTPVGFALYVLEEIVSGVSEGLTTDCKTYTKPSSPYNN